VQKRYSELDSENPDLPKSGSHRFDWKRRVIMKYRITFVLLLLCASVLNASARTLIIEADGSGDYPTIQAGITVAVHHDTLLVMPGTYYESISYEGKKITIGSKYLTTGDESWIEQTIIDGSTYPTSVVVFASNEESQSILAGLTITGGFGSLYGLTYGAGICVFESSPTLHHLHIRENGSNNPDLIGGGIAIMRGSPALESLRIENNEAGNYGAGIAFMGDQCRVVLRECTLSGNIGHFSNMLDVDYGATVTLENCLLAANSGGSNYTGIYCVNGSRLNLIGVTLASNSGRQVRLASGSTMVMINSIAWGNFTPEFVMLGYGDPSTLVVTHCDISGGYDGIETNGNGNVVWLDGNLDSDPLFNEPDASDFTLDMNSPCIDAGTDYFVWDEVTLVDLDPGAYFGEAPDMGVFEYRPDPAAASDDFDPSIVQLAALPNPFRLGTSLQFVLSAPEQIQLGVYDTSGRLVRTIADQELSAGKTSLNWDGCDDQGRHVSQGMYLLRLKTAKETRAIKLSSVR
jgi:FlgD Ig-like domain/Right handed beta helix region